MGELFIAGLTLGVSQCSLFCAPLLVLYVAGTTEGWKQGLKAALIFSLARVLAYSLLGSLAGLIGMKLVENLRGETLTLWIQLAAGVFVLLLGILIMLGRNPQVHLCRYLSQHTLNSSTFSMGMLGFLIGIAPGCAPFLGILTYIAFLVKDPLLGTLAGLSFGLGAALFTSLIIAGPLAAVVPKLVFKSPWLLEIFRWTAGIILLIFGLRLLFMELGSL